jgi:hypothetical protein
MLPDEFRLNKLSDHNVCFPPYLASDDVDSLDPIFENDEAEVESTLPLINSFDTRMMLP